MKRLLLLTVFAGLVIADDTLTIIDAMNLAVERNLSIKAAAGKRRSLNLAEDSKARALLPNITLGTGIPTYSYEESDVYIYVDSDPVSSWKEKYGGSVYLRFLYPTFWGGRMAVVPFVSNFRERYKLYNNRDIITSELLFRIRQPLIPESGDHRRLEEARLETNVQEIEYEIQRMNTLLDVANIYVNYYVAENKAQRARILSLMAADFVSETEAKVGNDDVRQEWIWTATSRSLGARADSISAEQELRLRREQLTNYLNLPADSTIYVTDPAVPALAMSPGELRELFIQQNPNIYKKAAALAKEEFKLDELIMKRRTKLAITASYALQGNGNTWDEAFDDFSGNRWDFGLSMTMPVLDFGAASYEIAAQREKVIAAKTDLEAEKRKQIAEINILIDKLNTLAARFDVLKESAIRAEKAINIVEEKYRNDQAELSQLYDSYNNFKASMDRAIDGKGEYYRTLIRIKLLCGIPTEASTF